jgi:anion-transporting  ArsA/GET3 family ATPase
MDFLTAPDKLARLMDEGVMRWLTLPNQSGGWRMIERGSEVLARVLENVVGEGTIREIAEFFSMFQALWEGFRDRSMRVRALLHEGETAFVLVTTPSPASRAEALDFLKVLKDGKLPFSGFLLNRCLLPAPQEVPDFGPAPAVLSATEWGQITQQLSQLPKLRTQLVRAQEDAIAALMASAPASAQAWRLPELEEIQAAQLPELQRLLKLSQSLPGLNILFKH